MAEVDEMDSFGEQVDALEDSLAGAQVVASTFAGVLQQMRTTMADTGREVTTLSNGISRGLRGAFDGLLFDGLKLSEAMSKVGNSMLNATYSAAVNPVSRHVGRLAGGGIEAVIGGLTGAVTGSGGAFAKGAGFTQGRVMPFANGGIVNGPTTFPMRGGTGLMGEAGPEAILPLARGADGKLGVHAQGSSQPIQVVMNITTPDTEGFRRSQGQIAAQMGRALNRGQRNR
ncbi:MAG: phage tail tape measure protein [Pseudomonadota bacterium]